MSKISFLLLGFACVLLLPLTSSATKDEFLPVDHTAFDTIRGKKLKLISYGVILCLLLAYAIFTLFRQRAVNRAILRLEKQINQDVRAR